MPNFLTDDTKAILLLCAILGKNGSVKPLTQTEYTSLVRWLISENMRPADLLDGKHQDAAAMGAGLDPNRLNLLFGRGVQLGLAVDTWQRSGIWVISRSDKDYPVRYKQHLKEKAPPLLFGVGDRILLRGGGLAIVGSRKIDASGEHFARDAASLCARNLQPVVSGGARGVDQIAMCGALESGGVSIGILADNLLKKSLERQSRNAISDGRLLLISPYHPEAHFTVGTAMGRNKLIYAMADYALIVSAEYKKGGTWAGAEEELKREHHLPVFVRLTEGAPAGNRKLLDMGAITWPDSMDSQDLRQELGKAAEASKMSKPQAELSLFDFQSQKENIPAVHEPQEIIATAIPVAETLTQEAALTNTRDSIFDAVLPVILDHVQEPIAADALAETLAVSKAQLNVWLKKAVEGGMVRKLSRPVRYCKSVSQEEIAAGDVYK